MKNVLVIGGDGFIGSHVVEKLLGENCKVYLLGIGRPNNTLVDSKRYIGKLEDYKLIENIILENSIDTLIHLASTLIPSSNLDDYILEFDQIIQPTIKLLPLLVTNKVKLVYFSSGGTIYGVNETGMFSEKSETNPISYYGQSKLIIENAILMENRRMGLNFLIVRPSNPYGIGQNIYGKQGLIAASIGKIINNGCVTIWGDGQVIRDYIHVDDLVNATVMLIQKGINNEIFNIGSGVGYSVVQIVALIKKAVGYDFDVVFSEGRSIDVPTMILDVKKVNSIVGDKRVSIENGIKEFYINELGKN